MPSPKGFGASPRPWTFRLCDSDGTVASFTIAAIDGNPMRQKDASRTVVLVVSLLQQPTDSGCRQRLETVLSPAEVEALLSLVPDLDPVFWVDAIDPSGRRVGQGHSQASGTRQEGPIRRVNPANLLRRA